MPQTPILHALSAALGAADTTPDAELLRRFAEAGDRAAFELVVRRHAELVWGACRAALPHDYPTAEDAFQATFLALARKAGSVRGASAAGWLFRVARRVAVRARARAARRTAGPLPDALAAAGVPVEDGAAAREAAPVVAEEIDRLAAKFRDPVLLCFFEGHTHAEAAARLGWPVGTVASRLARAKELLRARLTRRGVALPAAGLGAVFAPAPAPAALPVEAALAVATGTADRVPQSVLSLTHGVLSVMRNTRLKVLAALALLAAGLTVALAAVPGRDPRPADPAPAEPAPPPRVAGDKTDAAERLKPLQGKWRNAEDGTPDGDKADPFRRVNQLAHTLVTVVGDKMVTRDIQGAIEVGPGDEQSFLPLTEALRFPADGGPQALDLVITGGLGGFEGVTLPARYKLDGDQLTFCVRDLDHLKKGRPTEFKADATQGVIVLERVRDEKAELAALAGEWAGTKLVFVPEGPREVPGAVNGGLLAWGEEEIVADTGAKPKWVIGGAGLRFAGAGEPGETATVRLDPAASPPAIDLTVTRGGGTTKLAGIYWRRGNKLALCFADPEAKAAARPTALTPSPDVLFYTLERTPKK